MRAPFKLYAECNVEKSEATLPPLPAVGDVRPLQNLPIPSPATTFNDPSSVRSSTSNGSTYTASPSTTKQTPPNPLPTFPPMSLPQMSTFDGTGPASTPQLMSNRPPEDKLGIDYVMQQHGNSSQDQRRLPGERTRSGSSNVALLPQNTLQIPVVGLDAQGLALPPWAMPPRNTLPSCPLDGLLLDFLNDNRRQAIEGIPIQDLAGPAYPSFLSLMQPQRRSWTHPLSKVFTDMLSKFPDIATRPEQVAILFVFSASLSLTQADYSQTCHVSLHAMASLSDCRELQPPPHLDRPSSLTTLHRASCLD